MTRDRNMPSSIETTTSTPSSPPSKRNIIRNSILAGSLAGITSTVAVHPFDVLRTKIQSTTQKKLVSTITNSCNKCIQQPSVSQVWHQTLQNGGFRAFYTGLSMPLLAQAVYKSTVFSINNLCRDYLLERKKRSQSSSAGQQQQQKAKLSIMDLFGCGVIAGAMNAAAFVTPVEFIRNKLILEDGPKQHLRGPYHVVRTTIASSDGILGLWKGISLTVARDSIGCGFFFASMALCQKAFASDEDDDDDDDKKKKPVSFGVTLLSGMVAGLGFWAAALPLDTLKTWRQTSSSSSSSSNSRNNNVLLESITKHGWKETAQHLTRGWPVAFGRGAPSAAITIVTYQYCYDALEAM